MYNCITVVKHSIELYYTIHRCFTHYTYVHVSMVYVYESRNKGLPRFHKNYWVLVGFARPDGLPICTTVKCTTLYVCRFCTIRFVRVVDLWQVLSLHIIHTISVVVPQPQSITCCPALLSLPINSLLRALWPNMTLLPVVVADVL